MAILCLQVHSHPYSKVISLQKMVFDRCQKLPRYKIAPLQGPPALPFCRGHFNGDKKGQVCLVAVALQPWPSPSFSCTLLLAILSLWEFSAGCFWCLWVGGCFSLAHALALFTGSPVVEPTSRQSLYLSPFRCRLFVPFPVSTVSC